MLKNMCALLLPQEFTSDNLFWTPHDLKQGLVRSKSECTNFYVKWISGPCVKKMLLYNTMTPSVPIFNKKSFNYQNLVTTIVRFCTLLNVKDVMLLHSFKGDQLKSSSCTRM